jgi:hypothetical protein
MSSKLKSESARTNGAKSHGPVTPEGKARSSSNALRHGLTANFTVLEHESQEDFQLLLDAQLDRYQPADPVEMELVQSMAISRWRLRRIGNLESYLLAIEIASSKIQVDRIFETIHDSGRLAVAFRTLADQGNALTLLLRYEGSLNRMHDRAFKQLELLRSRVPRNEPTEPLTPVISSVPEPDPAFFGPIPVSSQWTPPREISFLTPCTRLPDPRARTSDREGA